MPNVYPMEYEFGRCRDRDGRSGVPYYAVRDIRPNEQLTVCYGPHYDRRGHYETVQLLKYTPGQFFKRHHDSYDGAFGGQAMGHRIMTAFMCAHAAPRVTDCLSD